MNARKIFVIKLLHSIVFFFMVACLAYILYCAAARRYDWTLLIALTAIFIEGLALLLNRWRCPLTTLAERYGAKNGAVTSIFLPKFLARYVFKFFGVLSSVELILLGWWYFS